MRKTLLMSAALLGMAVAAPAFAQGGVSNTQSPPTPNAGMSEPQPTNSLPPGGPTATGTRPGDAVGAERTSPAPMRGQPMTGVRPMRGQAADPMPMRGMPAHGGSHGQTRGMPPAGHAATGSSHGMSGSEPSSARASNIDQADTRSEIAPRLPTPNASSNTPEAFLMAAQRALAAGRTGQAQEALERAETRLLTRSTDPSMANTPDSSPMIQQIGEARRALARRDRAGARRAIDMAVASNTGGMGQGGMGQGGMGQGGMGQGGMGQGGMGQGGMGQGGMGQGGMGQGGMGQGGMGQGGMGQGSMGSGGMSTGGGMGAMPSSGGMSGSPR